MIILCTVDITTREVTIPSDQRIASYDHKVDVIRFQVETIPGFSLDTSTIRIAAQGPNKARHDYAVDPATVSIEEETGYITFDWPIPAGVTEMPIGSGFKYGDKGQLIFAVCAEIIDGSTVSKAWHSDDGIITVVAHLEPEAGGGEDPEEEATNRQMIGQLQTDVAVVQREVAAVAGGTPTVVDSKSAMTEHDKIYILSSDGKWYYYSATAEDWLVGGTYGGAVTDTTLSISGAAADAKAVGDAIAGITIEVDDTLTEQGKAADAKAVGNAIAGITIEVDDTLSEQGKAADAKAVGDAVDAISGRVSELESGSAYIEPTEVTVTLVPTVTLPDTRIAGGSATAKSGENSYLFSFADMEALGVSALISKFTTGVAYAGVYTYDQSTDTYTYTSGVIANYAPTIRDGYDGFFYTMRNTFSLDDLVFYTAIPVVTKDGYKHPTQRGFRSIAHEPLPLVGAPATGYIRFGGIEENTVCIMDTSTVDPTGKVQMWGQPAKTIANNYYLQLGATQYMYANIGKAPTYLEIRPAQQTDKLRALIKRGIYLWELNDIEDLVQARTRIPIRAQVHAGNFMDQMLFALAQGWSGCEVDVRATSDGVYVFSHDTTYRNVPIESSTYADLVDTAPDIMTMDEMLRLLAKFKGDIMFHWGGVADSATRLKHIHKAYGYGVNLVSYSYVSAGNIGDISAADFWKTGVAYCSSLPDAYRDLTHPNAKYDIGSGLEWKSAELGSGITLTYTNLTDGTYGEYNFLLAYIHLPCLYQ